MNGINGIVTNQLVETKTLTNPPPTHTPPPPPPLGSAFAAGKNDYGQIGLEGPESVKTFTKISLGGGTDNDGGGGVKLASCGYYHTLFLTRHGLVLGTGRNDYGQLGLGHAQARVFGPHVIGYLRDKNVVSVAAGCYHSVAVTGNGMLYFFGRNNHGKKRTLSFNVLSQSFLRYLLSRTLTYPISLRPFAHLVH